MAGLLREIYRAFKDALFPSKCLVCNEFYHPDTPQNDTFYAPSIIAGSKTEAFQKVLSPFLCRTCLGGFQPVESPVCISCGRMFESRAGQDHICQECLERSRAYGKARAFGVYDRVLMEVIHCYKYKGHIQLAVPLGWLAFFEFMRHWQNEKIDVVLPVPLHIRRFRKRGFNQSFLLIRDWIEKAGACQIPSPDFRIDPGVLFRSRMTEPQTFLDRKSRIENIKNAFTLNPCTDVKDKRLLVVDDVYTTGATIHECIKVLRAAGASRVDVLTLARAL